MFHIFKAEEEVRFSFLPVISKIIEVRDRSLVCTELNVHKHNPELFACLDRVAWGFWVCRKPGSTPGRPEYLRLEPRQMLLVEPGTWHFGPIPLFGNVGYFQLTTGPYVAEFDTRTEKLHRPFTPPVEKR